MSKQAYKIQIEYTQDLLRIKREGNPPYTDLEFSRLILALKESGYKIQDPPSLLYTQVKDYILSTWSKSITQDTGIVLEATNGHYQIIFEQESGGTAFLDIIRGNAMVPVFDGYIRSIADFITILELTRTPQGIQSMSSWPVDPKVPGDEGTYAGDPGKTQDTPEQVFEQIKDWLQKEYKYARVVSGKTRTLIYIGSHVVCIEHNFKGIPSLPTTIEVGTKTKFDGYIKSLSEFKLIWARTH